jgi:hypothetical protein
MLARLPVAKLLLPAGHERAGFVGAYHDDISTS